MVALESSVFVQGLPRPENRTAAERMAAAVEACDAVPAVTAVVSGQPWLGLSRDAFEQLLGQPGTMKASSRDLPVAMASGGTAATTVAASLAICRAAGVEVFATGGIGGVHREPAFDESADLLELARTPAIVVCSGAKSILDLRATAERLETLGITVVGYRTGEFPGFFFGSTGLRVPATVSAAREIAAIFRAQRQLGLSSALLVVQPPPESEALDRSEVERIIDRALSEARRRGVAGPATTPWLLDAVRQLTGGRSLRTNLALLESNARLAGEVARALMEKES